MLQRGKCADFTEEVAFELHLQGRVVAFGREKGGESSFRERNSKSQGSKVGVLLIDLSQTG